MIGCALLIFAILPAISRSVQWLDNNHRRACWHSAGSDMCLPCLALSCGCRWSTCLCTCSSTGVPCATCPRLEVFQVQVAVTWSMHCADPGVCSFFSFFLNSLHLCFKEICHKPEQSSRNSLFPMLAWSMAVIAIVCSPSCILLAPSLMLGGFSSLEVAIWLTAARVWLLLIFFQRYVYTTDGVIEKGFCLALSLCLV